MASRSSAIGGLGRHELLPYSDLDLVLLHDNKSADVLGPVADKLWYPLWDANIRLDHSVRTVCGALATANADMMAALGMLEARHIAGDERLSDELIAGVTTAVAQRNPLSHGRTRRNDARPLATPAAGSRTAPSPT